MFANGQEWQEQRRFTLRNLRDFGFGKVSMEGLIQEEVEKCIEMLSQEAGKVTQLSLKLNIAILNALWKLLTGEKVCENILIWIFYFHYFIFVIQTKISHIYSFISFVTVGI